MRRSLAVPAEELHGFGTNATDVGTRLVLAAVAAALVLGMTPVARAWTDDDVVMHTQPGNGLTGSRDYWVYVPRKLAPPPTRSLVLLLHGCGQSAKDAWQGVGWNDLADRKGFVVAYPEQRTSGTDDNPADGNGAHCWNSGQAPAFDKGVGELEVVAAITRRLASTYKIHPGRVFIAGISSGALMTAAMAATYPELYAAMGSVVGCGYPCGEPTGAPAYLRMAAEARRVPGIFIAGDADYLMNMALSQGGVSGWVGANDLADDGEMNGSVSHTAETQDRDSGPPQDPSTDLCVQEWNNPCPADVMGWTDYPSTISRYRDSTSGAVVVESWVLHGMSHNYPGGDRSAGTFTDPHGPSATQLLWSFFAASAR